VLDLYGILQRTAARCTALLAASSAALPQQQPSVQQSDVHSQLQQVLLEGSCEVTQALVQAGWSCVDIDTLPVGVGLPLREALQRVRSHPPPGWPVQAYALIGREDIAATLAASGGSPVAEQLDASSTVKEQLPQAAGAIALSFPSLKAGKGSLPQLATPATPVHQPVPAPWMSRTPSSGVVSIGPAGFTPAAGHSTGAAPQPTQAGGSDSWAVKGKASQGRDASTAADAHDW
jgi:anaphase-promoting complex subunit 1